VAKEKTAEYAEVAYEKAASVGFSYSILVFSIFNANSNTQGAVLVREKSIVAAEVAYERASEAVSVAGEKAANASFHSSAILD